MLSSHSSVQSMQNEPQPKSKAIGKVMSMLAKCFRNITEVQQSFPIIVSAIECRLYLLGIDEETRKIAATEWKQKNIDLAKKQILEFTRQKSNADLTAFAVALADRLAYFIEKTQDNKLEEVLLELIKHTGDQYGEYKHYDAMISGFVGKAQTHLKQLGVSPQVLDSSKKAWNRLSGAIWPNVPLLERTSTNIFIAATAVLVLAVIASIIDRFFYDSQFSYSGSKFRNIQNIILVHYAPILLSGFIYDRYIENIKPKEMRTAIVTQLKTDLITNLLQRHQQIQKTKKINSNNSTASDDMLSIIDDIFSPFTLQKEKFVAPIVKEKVKTRKADPNAIAALELEAPKPKQHAVISIEDTQYVPLDRGFFRYNKSEMLTLFSQVNNDTKTGEQICRKVFDNVDAKRKIKTPPTNQVKDASSSFFKHDGKIKLKRCDYRATTLKREANAVEIANGINGKVHEVDQILDHRADKRKI